MAGDEHSCLPDRLPRLSQSSLDRASERNDSVEQLSQTFTEAGRIQVAHGKFVAVSGGRGVSASRPALRSTS